MAFDYTGLAAVALELVTDFGREVTLLQLSATAANPAQPWRGQADPRSTPAGSKAVSAVFVDPSSLDALGRETTRGDSWVARASQMVIIATSEDLEKYDELVDTDGSRFKVIGVRMLKPGPVNLLAYVGVAR